MAKRGELKMQMGIAEGETLDGNQVAAATATDLAAISCETHDEWVTKVDRTLAECARMRRREDRAVYTAATGEEASDLPTRTMSFEEGVAKDIDFQIIVYTLTPRPGFILEAARATRLIGFYAWVSAQPPGSKFTTEELTEQFGCFERDVLDLLRDLARRGEIHPQSPMNPVKDAWDGNLAGFHRQWDIVLTVVENDQRQKE